MSDDPRKILAAADRSRAVAEAAREMRRRFHALHPEPAGTVNGKPGILRRIWKGQPRVEEKVFEPFDKFWAEALAHALSKVADEYEEYARQAEKRVTTSEATR